MLEARDLQRKEKASMHHVVCINGVEPSAPVKKSVF